MKKLFLFALCTSGTLVAMDGRSPFQSPLPTRLSPNSQKQIDKFQKILPECKKNIAEATSNKPNFSKKNSEKARQIELYKARKAKQLKRSQSCE